MSLGILNERVYCIQVRAFGFSVVFILLVFVSGIHKVARKHLESIASCHQWATLKPETFYQSSSMTTNYLCAT
jgi:hypothetical protein